MANTLAVRLQLGKNYLEQYVWTSFTGNERVRTKLAAFNQDLKRNFVQDSPRYPPLPYRSMTRTQMRKHYVEFTRDSLLLSLYKYIHIYTYRCVFLDRMRFSGDERAGRRARCVATNCPALDCLADHGNTAAFVRKLWVFLAPYTIDDVVTKKGVLRSTEFIVYCLI